MYWMQTYTGKRFYFDKSNPNDVDIDDIAHALSFQCRYNGHTKEFYSVAQHSYLVSTLCPEGLELHGLLHDAVEAYVGDMVWPLKQMIPGFKTVETQIEKTIFLRFGLEWPSPSAIKEIDRRIRTNERRDLLLHRLDWEDETEPIPDLRIIPWTSRIAEGMFLARFLDLYKPQEWDK